MKLLLTSAGNRNASIEHALLQLIGKPFSEANITFIPTSANVSSEDKSWLVDDMYSFRKLNFKIFDIVDIAALGKNIWLPSFERADVLVFGGGNNEYLLEWLDKSGVKQELPRLLQDKVYVGISAGSMVTAKSVSLSSDSILYYEKEGKLKRMIGLGFVDFEIRPHLNSPHFPKVRTGFLQKLSEEEKNISFYAIDNDTAIKIDGDSLEVISEGEWKKFN